VPDLQTGTGNRLGSLTSSGSIMESTWSRGGDASGPLGLWTADISTRRPGYSCRS